MLSRSLISRGMLKIPGRKCLDDIMKTDLLTPLNPTELMNLWTGHHQQVIQYWGRVISTPAYEAIRVRLVESPYFVVPVFRDKGLFNVVTCFDQDLVGVVPLKEYQEQQDHAQVHMTVQFFTELSRSKGLVLVRTEIKDQIFTRTDCIFVCTMLLKYYSLPAKYHQWVETFNKNPNAFDYHAYLRQMKDEAQRDNIQILDKKTERRTTTSSPSSGSGLIL
eukprot:PhF_6_TR35204/c0_g1_i1/m.51263/K07555/ATPeAF1, ATPAF1, ATP11; ATP synthase mitochondrial F1 complex assembly factor 1